MSVPAVDVGYQTTVPKSAVTADLIQWVLPPEFFNDVLQSFDYAGIAARYFNTAHNTRDWLALNGFNDWPENGGVLTTPVSWFNDSAMFTFSGGPVQVDLHSPFGSAINWLLVSFASAALLAKLYKK